jgi:hypothetical protein
MGSASGDLGRIEMPGFQQVRFLNRTEDTIGFHLRVSGGGNTDEVNGTVGPRGCVLENAANDLGLTKFTVAGSTLNLSSGATMQLSADLDIPSGGNEFREAVITVEEPSRAFLWGVCAFPPNNHQVVRREYVLV